MRSIWNGAISFGLVNIPVKLYAATENKDIRFNYLHDVCKTPIKYKKICTVCDREVSQEEIVRGYEYQKGKFVVIKDEDFENLPLDSLKSIQIIDFVEQQEIDPIYYQKPYYLAPADFGLKPYKLLYQALKDAGKVAVAKVFLRTRENLACLRVYQKCILMEMMYFPEEIRLPEGLEGLDNEINLHQNELKMAQSLIENLTGNFSPEKYTSDYRAALRELIEARIADRQIAQPQQLEDNKVVDLMEALRASVKATEKKAKQKSRKKAAKG